MRFGKKPGWINMPTFGKTSTLSTTHRPRTSTTIALPARVGYIEGEIPPTVVGITEVCTAWRPDTAFPAR